MTTEYRLRIEQDSDPMSPEDWDSGCALITTRNRYFAPKPPEGWSVDRCQQALLSGPSEDREAYAFFPLHALIHSGILLSIAEFADPWDSGQIGYVRVSLDGFNQAEIALGVSRRIAKGYVKTWNKFLSGDVYGFIVEKVETCDMGHEHAEIVESCWGFYGRENAEQEGQSALHYWLTRETVQS